MPTRASLAETTGCRRLLGDAPRRSPSGCREAPFFEQRSCRFGDPFAGGSTRATSARENPASAVEASGSCSRGGRSWRSAPRCQRHEIGPGPGANPVAAQASGPAMMTAVQRRFLVCRQPPRRVARSWTVREAPRQSLCIVTNRPRSRSVWRSITRKPRGISPGRSPPKAFAIRIVPAAAARPYDSTRGPAPKLQRRSNHPVS